MGGRVGVEEEEEEEEGKVCWIAIICYWEYHGMVNLWASWFFGNYGTFWGGSLVDERTEKWRFLEASEWRDDGGRRSWCWGCEQSLVMNSKQEWVRTRWLGGVYRRERKRRKVAMCENSERRRRGRRNPLTYQFHSVKCGYQKIVYIVPAKLTDERKIKINMTS